MSLTDKQSHLIDRAKNDYLEQDAIEQGTQLVKEQLSIDQRIRINFTQSELDKMRDLKLSLNLSQETLVESAIQYVYYCFADNLESLNPIIEDHAKIYNTELEQLKPEGLPRKERDKFVTKIQLSLPIADKLEKMVMEDRINECIFTGVNLLHENLIEKIEVTRQKKQNGLSSY
ncbi:hypothetical protein [Spirulina subsalsa]|uniref:hypothetical protein n=1 Tax=Spirulina subsalsa TaxID=54311 RepID=UPI0003060F96|nr:hypothetical protein [Spirulina subsalsa]